MKMENTLKDPEFADPHVWAPVQEAYEAYMEDEDAASVNAVWDALYDYVQKVWGPDMLVEPFYEDRPDEMTVEQANHWNRILIQVGLI